MRYIRRFGQFSYFKKDVFTDDNISLVPEPEIINNVTSMYVRSMLSDFTASENDTKEIVENDTDIIIYQKDGNVSIVPKRSVVNMFIKFHDGKIVVNEEKKK